MDLSFSKVFLRSLGLDSGPAITEDHDSDSRMERVRVTTWISWAPSRSAALLSPDLPGDDTDKWVFGSGLSIYNLGFRV